MNKSKTTRWIKVILPLELSIFLKKASKIMDLHVRQIFSRAVKEYLTKHKDDPIPEKTIYKSNQKVGYGYRVSPELRQEVRNLCKKHNITLTFFLIHALKKYFYDSSRQDILKEIKESKD